jgi:hypothetical protein
MRRTRTLAIVRLRARGTPPCCDNADKAVTNKGPLAAPGPISREQLEYHLGTLQADLRMAGFLAPLLKD